LKSNVDIEIFFSMDQIQYWLERGKVAPEKIVSLWKLVPRAIKSGGSLEKGRYQSSVGMKPRDRVLRVAIVGTKQARCKNVAGTIGGRRDRRDLVIESGSLHETSVE
jgi:hypothetical protein